MLDLLFNYRHPFYFLNEIPEGYSLVESEEHKKKRLETELSRQKQLKKYYEERIISIDGEIKQIESEIK